MLLATVLPFVSRAHGETLRYRFASVTTGAHATALAGVVATDGTRCRIDFNPDPQGVREMTSILCGDGGELLALNSANKTWFRLKSRARLAVSSALFSVYDAVPSKVKITSDVASHGAEYDSSTGRVKFSYRINFVAGGEPLTGEVWGEIKVWTGRVSHKGALPWSPADIATGYPAIDDELRHALAGFAEIERTETTLSRRIANGETMTQTIVRRIDWMDASSAAAPSYVVPTDYRYQEPLVGAPGPH